MLRSWTFIVTTLGMGLLLHLLRFPQLILDNGGGGFLILFFFIINIIGLPLLIAERAMDIKLVDISLKSWLKLFPTRRLQFLSRILWWAWFVSRFLVLTTVLWFFLYISMVSLSHMVHFVGLSLGFIYNIVDIPSFPTMKLSLFSILIYLVMFLVYFLISRWPLVVGLQKLLLPFCLAAFFVLFMKVILSVNDYNGLRVLFYPDFVSLNYQSLQSAIGHSLLCLLIGLGFYRQSILNSGERDPIELFIRLIVQNLFLVILVGVMAFPMIEEASEIPIGSRWLFEVMPRWLSYGEFANYYCFLYFFALFFLSFFLCVSFFQTMTSHIKNVYKLPSWAKLLLSGLFVLLSALILLLLQEGLAGWAGQSLYVFIDNIVVNWVLPVISLLLLLFVFVYLSRSEQREVFNHQQVFFHNQVFFKVWRFMALVIVPFLIVLSLVLGTYSF
jgi:neurotransmitter:Na+ symporter, NSS family